MSPQLSSDRILRLVTHHTNKECAMCDTTKLGPRWEYRHYKYVPSHSPEILLLCRKCIYKEVYGTKNASKADRQRLLHRLNYDYGNNTPKVEK
tara:strand:+ start:14078 stop:14356 length:279 start_codon:yes stop_codon:yes gene_type:complete